MPPISPPTACPRRAGWSWPPARWRSKTSASPCAPSIWPIWRIWDAAASSPSTPARPIANTSCELRRKARAFAEARDLFAVNIAAFERAWYGQHEVSADDAAGFRQRIESIKAALAAPQGGRRMTAPSANARAGFLIVLLAALFTLG